MLGKFRRNVFLIISILWIVGCSPEAGTEKELPVGENASVQLTVTVPDGVDGPTYGPETIKLEQDDTVYEVLLKSGLEVEAVGSGATMYIGGIDGLNERTEGPLSGWEYKVDDEFPGSSAGMYTLVDGQVVEWVFMLDFTEK